ncbi:unnamed protein product [Cunninghamella echinulata]
MIGILSFGCEKNLQQTTELLYQNQDQALNNNNRDQQLVYNNKKIDNKIKKETKEEYGRLTQQPELRVKAAFVVLVRNNELHAMRSSMQYLEDHLIISTTILGSF